MNIYGSKGIHIDLNLRRYIKYIGMCTYFGYNKSDTVHLALVLADKIFPILALSILVISYAVFLKEVGLVENSKYGFVLVLAFLQFCISKDLLFFI